MHTDAVVVGGGFYGSMVAHRLAEAGRSVVLVEREPGLLRRASLVNQARIHGGYHYPRSYLTARRSRVNYGRYLAAFGDTLVGGITHLYAVPRFGSKTSARQFRTFSDRIGAPVWEASSEAVRLFDRRLIDLVLRVEEGVFDAEGLAAAMTRLLEASRVDVRTSTAVSAVALRPGGGLAVELADGGLLEAPLVFSCTYAELPRFLAAAGDPTPRLKLEMAEIAVMQVPSDLAGYAVTVMDGPFFSAMPFPPAHAYSLTHVRYTPRGAISTTSADYRPNAEVQGPLRTSATPNAERMQRDAARYVPSIGRATLVGSWFEAKALLLASEVDDSRPILVARSQRLPGLYAVLGSKLDNVFDVLDEVDLIMQRAL